MKKTLLWILSICILVTLMGTMVACNLMGNNSNQTQSGEGSGVSAGDGAGDGAGEGEGDGGGSSIDTSVVHTEVMKTRSELVNKLGLEYYIKAKSLSGIGVAELATDGTYTYYTRPERTFIKTSGNKTYVYSDLRDDDKYYAMELDPDYEAVDPLTVGNVANIFLYAGETISYHEKTEVTFADRTAYKYVYVNAAGAQEELIIEKYAGFCLKHDGKNAETDSFTGGEAKASFEVVALHTGNNAKNTLKTITAMAEINGWDTAWFKTAGLNTSTLQVLGGDLISAEWVGNKSEWVAVYNLASATPDTKRTKIRDVMKSFYDAGAKYNDSRMQSSFTAGLFQNDTTEMTFSGRIYGESGDYSVFILAEYKEDAATPYWEVTYHISEY